MVYACHNTNMMYTSFISSTICNLYDMQETNTKIFLELTDFSYYWQSDPYILTYFIYLFILQISIY